MQVRCRTAKQDWSLTLTLYVRWFSPQGRTKVNRLLLRPVTSVEALQVRSLELADAFEHRNHKHNQKTTLVFSPN